MTHPMRLDDSIHQPTPTPRPTVDGLADTATDMNRTATDITRRKGKPPTVIQSAAAINRQGKPPTGIQPAVIASVEASPDAPPDNSLECPDCGGELSDPVNIGWCLRCGYCRYLENRQEVAAAPKAALDPEVQLCVDLLRALTKRLKGVTTNDCELTGYVDLILNLGRRTQKKGARLEDLVRYRDLLKAFEPNLKTEREGTPIPITGYFDLLKALATKYRDDVKSETRQRLLPLLNIPLPMMATVPDWVAILACGVVLCALGSFTSGMNLRGTEQARFIWCLMQVGTGIALILAAQTTAFLQIVPASFRRKQWKIFVLPTMLWDAVWYRLPTTRWPLWLLAWGATLDVGAVVIYLM